jgi:hypothetical protein
LAPASPREWLDIDAMKKVLVVAAIAEVVTGLALLIVPSLLGRAKNLRASPSRSRAWQASP